MKAARAIRAAQQGPFDAQHIQAQAIGQRLAARPQVAVEVQQHPAPDDRALGIAVHADHRRARAHVAIGHAVVEAVVRVAEMAQAVDLGRALALEPQVLLLDEPMAGMNVEEKQDMCRFILDVNDEFGTTIVLIEHDMGVVMDISDRVVVLDYGKKIGDGTPDEVRNNEEVISAYLGTSH